ncbi:MAG TPA: cytochrome c oxidase subunit II [Candidatus Baltobacteraceae bacterium]|nr:cytochrome c oxidase subunit II [Candidatus Baltobacteraceae bacterium]
MRWLLDPASVQGVTMRGDWYVFLIAAACVGLFVYGCIFWCIFAYRRSRNPQPAQFSGNKPLEVLYVVIPLLIVIGLFIVTMIAEIPVDRVAADPANKVGVIAFRWSWRFDYPGGITTIGTPFAPPTLYLPLREATEIDLTSADVTHSFWVPAFLFKRDAIPGMQNLFAITPTRVGTFRGRCAQFCGLDHALMTFQVKVVPDPAYERFIASRGVEVP